MTETKDEAGVAGLSSTAEDELTFIEARWPMALAVSIVLVIVLAGGVAESAPLFADEAREHYARVLTGAGHRPLARIRTSQLGDATAIVGAAALARERGA